MQHVPAVWANRYIGGAILVITLAAHSAYALRWDRRRGPTASKKTRHHPLSCCIKTKGGESTRMQTARDAGAGDAGESDPANATFQEAALFGLRTVEGESDVGKVRTSMV